MQAERLPSSAALVVTPDISLTLQRPVNHRRHSPDWSDEGWRALLHAGRHRQRKCNTQVTCLPLQAPAHAYKAYIKLQKIVL